ncbi:MAG: hypothetical protein ACRD0N_06270 [Acidimicrobiales bacterium]
MSSTSRPDRGPTLSLPQAARLAGLRLGQLFSLVSAGEIPAWRSGPCRFVYERDVDEWMGRREEPPA